MGNFIKLILIILISLSFQGCALLKSWYKENYEPTQDVVSVYDIGRGDYQINYKNGLHEIKHLSERELDELIIYITTPEEQAKDEALYKELYGPAEPPDTVKEPDRPLLDYDINKGTAFSKEQYITNLEDVRKSDKREVLSKYNAAIKHLELQMQSKTVDPFTGEVVHTGMTREQYCLLTKGLKQERDRQLRELDKKYDKKISDAENDNLYQEITDR